VLYNVYIQRIWICISKYREMRMVRKVTISQWKWIKSKNMLLMECSKLGILWDTCAFKRCLYTKNWRFNSIFSIVEKVTDILMCDDKKETLITKEMCRKTLFKYIQFDLACFVFQKVTIHINLWTVLSYVWKVSYISMNNEFQMKQQTESTS
jgi:hypothetical protein